MFMDLPLAAVMDVVRSAVMVIFIVSAFLLTVVILLQEGKGGGLAGAFGGAGAETFGVKAGTVNKFTAWLAALFLGLALLHAGLSAQDTDTGTAAPDTSEFTEPEKPENGGDAGDDTGGGNAGDEKKPADGDNEEKPGGGTGSGDDK